MNKQFYVMDSYRREFSDKENFYFCSGPFDTVDQARAYATEKANRRGRSFMVVEVLGAEVPVYDIEIGWEPATESSGRGAGDSPQSDAGRKE